MIHTTCPQTIPVYKNIPIACVIFQKRYIIPTQNQVPPIKDAASPFNWSYLFIFIRMEGILRPCAEYEHEKNERGVMDENDEYSESAMHNHFSGNIARTANERGPGPCPQTGNK